MAVSIETANASSSRQRVPSQHINAPIQRRSADRLHILARIAALMLLRRISVAEACQGRVFQPSRLRQRSRTRWDPPPAGSLSGELRRHDVIGTHHLTQCSMLACQEHHPASRRHSIHPNRPVRCVSRSSTKVTMSMGRQPSPDPIRAKMRRCGKKRLRPRSAATIGSAFKKNVFSRRERSSLVSEALPFSVFLTANILMLDCYPAF
jgi:hypothetical protein